MNDANLLDRLRQLIPPDLLVSSGPLDLEGGRFVVVIVAEMIQTLLNEGNADGAMIILRKLFEVADVTMPEWAELGDSQGSRWLELWTDALADAAG